MDRAKSIYLGGEIIWADDERVNYYSYKEAGFLCRVCKEPVYHKKGEEKVPHFAHHDSKISENCPLRTKSYAIDSFDSWTEHESIEGKQQRLKLFQRYFLEVVIGDYSDFTTSIGKIKHASPLGKLAEKSIEVFRSDNAVFKFSYGILYANQHHSLQRKIICEAVDYLCVKSSIEILRPLIYYSVYKLSEKGLLKYPYKQRFYEVCGNLMDIIVGANWLYTFSKASGFSEYPPCIENSLVSNLSIGHLKIDSLGSSGLYQVFFYTISNYRFDSTSTIGFLHSRKIKVKDKPDLNDVFTPTENFFEINNSLVEHLEPLIEKWLRLVSEN